MNVMGYHDVTVNHDVIITQLEASVALHVGAAAPFGSQVYIYAL